MGAHYRSVQVRSEDRSAVITAAEKLVREAKGKLLAGPAINGWIGLYPDDSVPKLFATELSKSLGSIVLELVVYHSDILFYNFFENGELTDEYSSDPDAFEEVSPAEHERLKGKPELFRALLGSDQKVKELRSLLAAKHEGEFLFEETRLEKFSELFGIKNTLASYDYLTDGEWHRIEGRKQFVHIPDLTAEKNAAKAAAAALRAEMKSLKKEGILCLELLPLGKGAITIGEVVFDPLNTGIVFGWGGSEESYYAKPPWTSEPEEILTSPPGNRGLVFSRSGKWLASAPYAGQLRLWNWPGRKLVEDTTVNAIPVQFSPDEKSLLCKTPHPRPGLELFSLESKKVTARIHTDAQFLAWHPSGRYLVTLPQQDKLGLIDLNTGTLIKTLYSGKVNDFSSLAPLFSGTLKKAGVSPEQLAQVEQSFIRGSEHTFNAKFNPDGRLLFCATTGGLRVFEWEKVLTADKTTPAPLFSVTPSELQPNRKIEPADDAKWAHLPPPVRQLIAQDRKSSGDHSDYVYDVELDLMRNRLLFAGIEGAIRYLNLDDGQTGILFKPPGTDYIWRIQLSPNGEYVCCSCTPEFGGRNKKPNCIKVWDYRLLWGLAGLD